jgi:hypothetical protein
VSVTDHRDVLRRMIELFMGVDQEGWFIAKDLPNHQVLAALMWALGDEPFGRLSLDDPRENELLALFRQMSDEQKEDLLAVMDAMVKQNRKRTRAKQQ